jgi:hypothetical protein
MRTILPKSSHRAAARRSRRSVVRMGRQFERHSLRVAPGPALVLLERCRNGGRFEEAHGNASEIAVGRAKRNDRCRKPRSGWIVKVSWTIGQTGGGCWISIKRHVDAEIIVGKANSAPSRTRELRKMGDSVRKTDKDPLGNFPNTTQNRENSTFCVTICEKPVYHPCGEELFKNDDSTNSVLHRTLIEMSGLFPKMSDCYSPLGKLSKIICTPTTIALDFTP